MPGDCIDSVHTPHYSLIPASLGMCKKTAFVLELTYTINYCLATVFYDFYNIRLCRLIIVHIQEKFRANLHLIIGVAIRTLGLRQNRDSSFFKIIFGPAIFAKDF